ncbi:hypothetical protein BJX96DRAFT_74969 [Aspergillus floccosus]
MGSHTGDTDVIQQFMKEYRRDFGRYESLAQKASEICAKAVHNGGVLCRTAFQAKCPDTLEAKLQQKAPLFPHRTVQEIKDQMVDLARVCVAVYVPRQQAQAGRLIKPCFNIIGGVNCPEEPHKKADEDGMPRGFPCSADHYYVHLKPEDGPAGLIEIQVVSMLRHACAVVGHDMERDASEVEHQILAGLNGAIALSEGLLNQLHERRTSGRPFESVYHLASYLFQRMQIRPGAALDDLGDVELLWQVLKIMDMNDRSQLRDLLDEARLPLRSATRGKQGRMTISIYLSEQIIRSPRGRSEIVAQFEAQGGNEPRSRLQVVINAFALLSHLLPFPAWVTPVMSLDGGTLDGRRHILAWLQWLDSEDPKNFYEYGMPMQHPETIDRLWGCLERHAETHEQSPVRFAFSLSKLGVVKNGRSVDWEGLTSAVRNLIACEEI